MPISAAPLNSTSYKIPEAVYAKHDGVYKEVQRIYGKRGGEYKQIYNKKTYELYGFKFDSGASTAATAITYLEDAVGKTPAGMNMGGTTTTVTSEIESGAIAGDGTEVSDNTCVRMVDMWPISTAKYTFSWTSSSTLLAKVYAYNFMTGTFISELTDGWTANDITLQVTSPVKIRVMFRTDPSAPISSSIVTGMTLTTVPYFSYGDWENAFFMPKPCMLKYDGTVDYYLDPSDYTIKAGETPSYTTTTVPCVQGNMFADGYGRIILNDATARCRTQNVIAIPAKTITSFEITNSDIIINEANFVNSSGTSVKTYNSTIYNNGVCYNYSDSVVYMYISFLNKNDGSAAISPSDFTFTMTTQTITTDIGNINYDGNAMMEWPKIWYKFEAGENAGEGYFYVSDTKVDNTYHCWCNYDALDNEIEHFYTAIYNSPTNKQLRSLSGINLVYWDPFLQSLNGRAHANNVNGYVEWQLEVFADRQLIDALIMLIGKSANVTSVFGNGLYGQSGSAQELLESYTTGTLNDKGLFWGDTSSGDNAVKIFGMENWWGLQSRVVNGILYVIEPNAMLYYKLTYGTADGSETTGYDTSSILQFLSINTNGEMGRYTGYITALTFANGIYYPSGVSTTNNIWNWKFKPYFTYPQYSKLFTYGGNIWDSVRSPNGIELDYKEADDYIMGGNLCCKPVAQTTT